MIPVANFQVTPTLLSVKFVDISTGTPTSWSWDFGDGSALDITQNPTHVYATPGLYIVKLTSTNVDGNSSLQREIRVNNTPILPVSLKTFVSLKLPLSLNISEETKDAYIAQWQLFIQPLVIPAVSEADVFNELAYPPLANALVAMLAAYSVLCDIAFKTGISAAGSGTDGNKGLVEKIVTGPSEVQFQDTSDMQKNLFGPNGLLKQLESEICSLSARLLIKLPMCPPLPAHIFIDKKAGRSRHHSARANYGGLTNESYSSWQSYPYTIKITC